MAARPRGELGQLHFGDVTVETRGDQHVFEVQVYLADLDPNAVRVELYANGVTGGPPVRQEMKRVRQLGRRISGLGVQRGCICELARQETTRLG